jgi:hypothetical protein
MAGVVGSDKNCIESGGYSTWEFPQLIQLARHVDGVDTGLKTGMLGPPKSCSPEEWHRDFENWFARRGNPFYSGSGLCR